MRRPERLEDQIQFILSALLQREVRDPELGFLTLTAVRLSPDNGVAKIYFTVLGEKEQLEASRRALGRASGFLRSQLAARIKLKRVPELRFMPDESINEGAHLESLFQQIHQEEAQRPLEAPEAES